jgi:checkpoint serine/threonine-protein kinase
VHADIKPDNFLVVNRHSSIDSEWELWRADGTARGWDSRGLKLIDFGRAIDLTLYPQGTRFVSDNHADEWQCIEMRNGQPWTYQLDLYGICGILHCLLHKQYMKVTQQTCRVTDRVLWRPVLKTRRYVTRRVMWQCVARVAY